MSNSMLVLLALFQIKHLLADYVWQTPYMLGKGKKGIEWILPLGAHCLVHSVLSAMIIVCFRPEMVWLVVVEFFAHFLIDRVKATYKLPAGQWANEEKGKYLGKYYFAFGMDQMAHHLTYIGMVYVLTQ
jgi:hypothetical protein